MSLMSNASVDVLCAVFEQELKFGNENWKDGTDARYFKRDAESTMTALRAAGQRGNVSFSHFLLAGTYGVLASDNDAILRQNLVYLAAQLHIWIESIDRRTAVAA